MGILRLHPEMKPAKTAVNVEIMSGKTAAVDVLGWIYKGLSVRDGRCDVNQFIFNRVNMLKHHKVDVILVFDGPEPPAKKELIKLRRMARMKKIDADTQLKLLRKKCARSVDLQDSVKNFCRTWGISYVVAPFEADAQMAYMMKTGEVQFLITEDSDMIVHGCNQILFRMTANGDGQLFDQADFEKCWGAPYDQDIFRAVCVMMGCDYLIGGVKGFGPVAAREMYQEMVSPFNYDQMVSLLKQPVDDGFEDKFQRSVNTYKYQPVYDKNTDTVVPLTPYPDGFSDVDFIYAGNPILAEGDYYSGDGKNLLPVGKLDHRIYPCTDCPETFQHRFVRQAHRKDIHPQQCATCQKIFSYKYLLNDHMLRHGDKATQICLICGKALWTKQRLMFHKIKVHRKDSRACDICGKAFKNSNSLGEHMRHVHQGRIHKCDICGAAFTRQSTLAQHALFLHSFERPFKCNICDRRFKTNSILTTHMKSHANKREYKCPHDGCSAAFNHAQNLEKHERIHTEEKPYMCMYCPQRLTTFESLSRHELIHLGIKKYVCGTCGKGCATSEELKTHQRVHTGEKPIKCKFCGKCFRRYDGRKYHHLICPDRPNKSNILPHLCGYCDQRFASSSQKTSHERTHTKEKPYKCEYCAYESSFKSALNVHRLTCKKRPNPSDDLPHKCAYCDKRFAKKIAQRDHENTHTGKKPYKCDFCGREFGNYNSFNAHRRNSCKDRPNVNDLPNQCDYCPKRFSTLQHKTSHEVTHTGEKPYKCPLCGKGFTQNGSMRVHMKTSCPNKPSTPEK